MGLTAVGYRDAQSGTLMDIHVHMGEWISALQNYMEAASDGDRFLLPTSMHLHAFLLLNNERFAGKHFKVEVNE